MSRRAITVRKLASEAKMDLDEALVTLWEAGYDDVSDADDRIPARHVSNARSALGLLTLREMRTPIYWEQKLGISRDELRARLDRLDIKLSANARMLPKGALAKLRRSDVASVSTALSLAGTSPEALERESLPTEPPFEWTTHGRSLRKASLTAEEVTRIHDTLEVEFATTSDPIEPAGVRDADLLESAVFRVETRLGSESKYPTAEMSAAALMHSIVHNHPFFNGNKRTALVSLLVVLDRNDVLLTCDEKQLFRVVLKVAAHRIVSAGWSQLADREVLAISKWICSNSRPIGKGDRLMKWRELRRVLTNLGCTLEGPLPGNRMKVRRRVKRKRGLLGGNKTRELVATVWYGGEGREVYRERVKSLRQELELDDEHGYDSAYFYGSDPREPDEFIAAHRNLLRRLAKL